MPGDRQRRGRHRPGHALPRRSLCVSNYYAGIYVTNVANQVLGNHVLWNRWGIEVSTNNNMIFKNTAFRNGIADYQFAGNKAGPITSDPAHTSPWANVTY